MNPVLRRFNEPRAGSIAQQKFLELPVVMNLKLEEDVWFARGVMQVVRALPIT